MRAKQVRVIGKWLLSVLVLPMSGCVSFVRTGQLFLTTRENCSFVSHRPCEEGMFNPLYVLGRPFVAVGTVSFAPAYDLVCLPVDLTLKAFGTRVSVVGEDGHPIGGAEVTCMGDRLWESWFDEGRYNTGVWAQYLDGGFVSVSKPGYYKSHVVIGRCVECRAANDSNFVTVALKRVEHPIPLWVKTATLSLDKDISSLPDGRFYFDFLAGDFLPPLGNGRHADVMFSRDARDDRGEGVNGANIKGRSFRDMIRVSFLGKENGLAEIKCDDKSGIRIRQAPESGYLSEYSIWHGVGKDLQFESSHNKDRDFCFRIRTECNDQGSISKAWYGKIYGDMKIWAGENYSVNGVSFRYYLNPNPLDRNLEWDMKTNLCPNPGSLGQLQP